MGDFERIGPIKVFGKVYASDNIDDFTYLTVDDNPPSGFTELFQLEPGSLVKTPGDEYLDLEIESIFGRTGRVKTKEGLILKATVRPKNMDEAAVALGALTTDVTDVDDDPDYSYFDHGGRNNIDLWSLIIQQKVTATLYRGIFIFKCDIVTAGDVPFNRLAYSDQPVEIHPVVMDSGAHIGKWYRELAQTAFVTPVIDSILPASQSVANLVTIKGNGFGNARGDSVVTFHDAKEAIAYDVWTDNVIVCTIPADAATGNVKVTVNGTDSANESYTIV